jgi:hypothetical protein
MLFLDDENYGGLCEEERERRNRRKVKNVYCR